MLKRSTSSRNQRSRGVKVKHVLQIVVLLGICFWLIYQVKYSHDKRRELSGRDSKVSQTEGGGGDGLNLGRKGLIPRVEEVGGADEKPVEEEEEDGDKHEGEEELDEELNKTDVGEKEETEKHEEEEEVEEGKGHEAEEEEEEEEEDSKIEELEDQMKQQDDVERDDIGDEKEREEDTSEEKNMAEGNEEEEVEEGEKQSLDGDENPNLAENETRDETERSTHEAREEHYKGDDASSAVTHDNNVLIGSGLEKSDSNDTNETKIATNTSNQNSNGDENGSRADGEVKDTAQKDLNLKETGADNKDHGNDTDAAKVLEDSPPQNSTVSTGNNGANITSTEKNGEDLSSSSPLNGTETISSLTLAQNSTVDGGDGNSNTTADAELTVANPGAVAGGTSNSTGTTDLGLAVPDQKSSSDEKVEGGGNIRLPSNMNNTQIHEPEERQNESGEVKTG